MFIHNAWYVAAWDRDLVGNLLALNILGQSVVLFRRSNGEAAALEDACVHRKLPLSMGRIRGDEVECGYHGLRFNASGVCTHIPCSDRIPRGAKIRAYPLVSRYGLLWIWMGQPEAVNPETIVDVAHWDEPGWAITHGDSMQVDCHYLYMTDNLLDPSHVAWVHPTSFGDAACEATPVTITSADSGITASRWMRGTQVAPLYRRFVRFTGACDRLQEYEVRFPCHARVTSIVVPAGSAADFARSDQSAFVMDSYNFLTPVDERHTRYFWLQIYNAGANEPNGASELAAGVKAAFEEDRVILGAVQRGFDRSTTPNIDIAIDSAPLRFRRRVQSLIDQEQHREPTDAPVGDLVR